MRPLSNVTVLDLTHMLSGPYGTMLLADLGARTIKVEPPAGENTRKLLATDPANSLHGMGAYFLTLNRNKESVCIDLKNDAGIATFYRLVEKADVVVNNFGPGVPQRLKIDWPTLSAINPRIITCSVTGFGESGPGSNRPAFDQVAQGMGGGMSITGYPGGEPLRAGIPIGDLGAGMFAAIGILAALNSCNVSGKGQHVDISMLDVQISLLNYMATMYFLSGDVPGPIGNGHFVHVPYNTFRTADRWIIIAVIADSGWTGLAKALNDPVLNDREYDNQPGRWRNKELINSRLQEILLTKTCDEWLELFQQHKVPSAPVNDFAHALNDQQVLSRNMVVSINHPQGGNVKMPGNPVKLSDTVSETFTAPPSLGQDTVAVLRSVLNLSDREIDALRAQGAV